MNKKNIYIYKGIGKEEGGGVDVFIFRGNENKRKRQREINK